MNAVLVIIVLIAGLVNLLVWFKDKTAFNLFVFGFTLGIALSMIAFWWVPKLIACYFIN